VAHYSHTRVIDLTDSIDAAKVDDQPQERHRDPPHDPSDRTAAHYPKVNH
jgi:hypothetical protein